MGKLSGREVLFKPEFSILADNFLSQIARQLELTNP